MSYDATENLELATCPKCGADICDTDYTPEVRELLGLRHERFRSCQADACELAGAGGRPMVVYSIDVEGDGRDPDFPLVEVATPVATVDADGVVRKLTDAARIR